MESVAENIIKQYISVSRWTYSESVTIIFNTEGAEQPIVFLEEE